MQPGAGAQPWGAAAGPAAGAAAAPAAEAKTAFDVILASVPADKKIAVIKAVREVKAGLGHGKTQVSVPKNKEPALTGTGAEG